VFDGPDQPSQPASSEGSGCHGGAVTMATAAAKAGKSEILARYAADYPKGPHDQPQSMCPAFGSLRVGLRMRRTATVLSGSACCVYGLTFTSHFYGARRTVGYVPFNSETLVTGKLFEDIREAVFKLADPELYDTIVVTNLCVPTASGVPLQLLPKEINGVRIIGSTCRASASRPTRKPRTCSPAPCSPTPVARWSRVPSPRRARAPTSRPSLCSARCSPPTR
jgi:chlorophyllide a reductase subunit Y